MVMMREDAALDDFERGLETVRAAAAGSVEGIFGPDSLTWRINREAITFLGAGRALLLQLAHPWIATAIAEHSRAAADPIGRFHRTFDIVYTMVFGSLEQALAASRRLRRRHATVSGTTPTDVGPYLRRSSYRANDVAALRWIYATLVDTALLVHDMVLPALTNSERQRYYSENRLFAALFGIASADLPLDWTAFAAYTEAMWHSDTLTVSPTAREMARQLLFGAGGRLRTPLWYRALTTLMLPPRLRAPFGLPLDERERRIAERALERIRGLYPLLPARLRFVGPYHEAIARLSGGRRPDLITRLANQVWIGHSFMV